jgi:hypothetical protein
VQQLPIDHASWSHPCRPCCSSGIAKGEMSGHKAAAYLVTIKDAGAPDVQGLLQMVLRYWQANMAPMTTFALPAVHAVIDFK